MSRLNVGYILVCETVCSKGFSNAELPSAVPADWLYIVILCVADITRYKFQNEIRIYRKSQQLCFLAAFLFSFCLVIFHTKRNIFSFNFQKYLTNKIYGDIIMTNDKDEDTNFDKNVFQRAVGRCETVDIIIVYPF